jgi:hypothetical protein
MTRFGPDLQPNGAQVSGVAGPTGQLIFTPALTHTRIGQGWATWSNGYIGDVYYTASDGSVASVTITLPAKTRAFYLYAEPNLFSTFSISATADDGTTSGQVGVDGYSGARYFGFYSQNGKRYVKSVTISIDNPMGAMGFGIGEFGIN